ncbi:cadherin-like protein 26 [Clinocottus analis]|uniref:cadherin-like protein 26 n=1 Tax=Clinocottus analis TaxID=304258 RepID=UPI0035BED64A
MKAIHLGLLLTLCVGAHASSSEVLKRQKRNWIIDSFSIDEGYSGPFPYVLGNVKIDKELTIFKINGQGVDLDPKGILQINKNTGDITVHQPVDFEKYNVLKLTFQALHAVSHVIDTQLGIELLIIDVNDNPPLFQHGVYNFHLPEATPQGTEEIKILARDKDRSKKFNSFDLKIVSVHPEPSDLEFFLIQHFETGTISFKGCLDHEKADKYTIIVEAKDNGEKRLSSSCTVIIHVEDGNNHLPVITGQTGSGRVKEGEENVLVNRLQVTDKDNKATAAWRAKFKIQGDADNNFRIATDPETNEGLLYVTKPLDYEHASMKNVTISVENEIRYHICQVLRRSADGLWEVTTRGGEPGTVGVRTVTVTVEDANDPPTFDRPKTQVTQRENVEVGKYLATLAARDPDVTSSNTFVYKKGHDPDDWVAVDPATGKITTTKLIDRESTFVKDNVYMVTVLAVDNGQPPMTGTATLDIFITDENDNAPSLADSIVHLCQSDGLSLANVTAVDSDETPYGGPFTFRLQEKEKGRWRLEPTQGFSVTLVKEPAVHAGLYELQLEVSDLQGLSAVHNVAVTVCNCKDAARPNCHLRKAASQVGGGALWVGFFCMMLLAGLLLLLLLMSCKKESKDITDEDTQHHLMKSNTESPGTDCQVHVSIASTKNSMQPNSWNQLEIESTMLRNFSRSQQRNSMREAMGASAAVSSQHRNSMRATWPGRNGYPANQENVIQEAMLRYLLNKMLSSREVPGEELGDYAPHVYAEEGGMMTSFELNAISIPDIPFDLHMDTHLASKFNTLASICTPTPSNERQGL